MQVPREMWTLKNALDELLTAHEAFDAATFYGDLNDIHQAQLRLDSTRRRAALASQRFVRAAQEFSALGGLLEGPDDIADLERRTRI